MTARKKPRGEPVYVPTVPNTTSVHIQRARPEPLRQAGLQDITDSISSYGRHGKKAQRAANARRMQERLAIASSAAPYCAATTSGEWSYPALQRNPGIPASRYVAFDLPSRMGNRLHYPDGRVTGLDGEPCETTAVKHNRGDA